MIAFRLVSFIARYASKYKQLQLLVRDVHVVGEVLAAIDAAAGPAEKHFSTIVIQCTKLTAFVYVPEVIEAESLTS